MQSDLSYQQTNIKIKSGDTLILTTDGVNEAQNSSRELFGDERLKNALLKLNTGELSSLDIKNAIISEVQEFIKKDKPLDDMTVLVVKIK